MAAGWAVAEGLDQHYWTGGLGRLVWLDFASRGITAAAAFAGGLAVSLAGERLWARGRRVLPWAALLVPAGWLFGAWEGGSLFRSLRQSSLGARATDWLRAVMPADEAYRLAEALTVPALAALVLLVAGWLLLRWFPRLPEALAAAARRGAPPALLVVSGLPLLAAGASAAGWFPRAPAGSPDVVLVTLDTLRADRVGCWGHPGARTPELDRLSRRGAQHIAAVSPSSWTAPAHASLFTGQLPSEHRLHAFRTKAAGGGNVPPLPLEAVTAAEILRARGYRTGAVVANYAYLAERYRLSQGFETWDVRPGSSGRVSYRTATEIRRTTRALLGRMGRGPRFLFVNFMDAHSPYLAPDIWQQVAGGEAALGDPDLLEDVTADILNRVRDLTPEEHAQLLAQYDAEIAFQDREFGRFLRDVARHLDDPLILVTSDHGEYFGEHGLILHSKDVHEPVIHVPLTIAGGGEPAGLEPEPVSTASLFHRIVGEAPPAAPFVLSEVYYALPKDLFHPEFGSRFDRIRRALRQGSIKYIGSSDEENELYDLQKDPAEHRNLVPEWPGVADRLRIELEGALPGGDPGDGPAPDAPPMSEEESRALEALGYL